MEALKIYIDDGMQIELGTGIGKYSLNLYNAMKEIGIDVTLADGYERTGNKTRDRINYLRYINSKEFQKHMGTSKNLLKSKWKGGIIKV